MGVGWVVFGRREVCVSVVWHHEVSPLLHSSLQGAAALGCFSSGALNSRSGLLEQNSYIKTK